METTNSLEGRVALVTGSSRGIGAAVAKLLAARGASVAVHGRDRHAISRVVDAISASGGLALGVTADITRFAEIESMRERIEQELGPVDILVANAGGAHEPPRLLEEATEEGFRSTVDGHLIATFLTLKSFLPGMKARRHGAIVTVSSAAARRPHVKNPLAYAAAKAGIEQLTQDLALQAGPANVRVNCVAPETILTQKNEELIPESIKPALVEAHPIRRLGTPEDVAGAVGFLVSEDAGWITGIVMDVAGGAVT
jgi:3-oxoacyl-[acyl-carrier protein] reductase